MKIKLSFTMGIILLSIGIILLLFSFILAYNSFTNYTLAIPSNYSDLSSAIINSSYELIILAAKIAFLGIMVLDFRNIYKVWSRCF